MGRNPLVALAGAAEDWRHRDIAPEVLHDTRRAVLDWFASMLPGCVEGPAVTLAKALASERGEGRAVAYTGGPTGSARHAALINGTGQPHGGIRRH